MNKKNALLIMAATGNYLFSAGNVLIGLKKYSPQMFDDIIIYTDASASEADKKAIQKIFPVQFKIYDFQIKNPADRERLKYYSNMPYARFEMLTYLDKYRKVFWFDTDFLITGDISGLLEYGKTGISMSIDLEPYPQGHGVHMFFIKDVPGYNMTAKAYASGLVIFSDKLPQPLKLREYLYQKLDQYSGYLKYAEQGLLQLMIEEFKLDVEEFPKLIYHAFPFEDMSKARIIHLLGRQKPWQFYTANAYDEWYENHCHWIELGGTEAFTFIPLIRKHPNAFYGPKRYQNILLFHYLDNLKTAALPVPSNNKQLLQDLANRHKISLQYYRCKILSKITWGNKRRHYKQKRNKLHEQVRQIRNRLKH